MNNEIDKEIHRELSVITFKITSLLLGLLTLITFGATMVK